MASTQENNFMLSLSKHEAAAPAADSMDHLCAYPQAQAERRPATPSASPCCRIQTSPE